MVLTVSSNLINISSICLDLQFKLTMVEDHGNLFGKGNGVKQKTTLAFGECAFSLI